MRTIDGASVADAAATDARIERVVAGLHDIIAGFRCAGTGRLVKLGVSMTHMHVLWILQHHGELAMSRMADLMDVSLSNATGIIDRMEERGLIERVRVPDDRRVVQVRIAPGGLQALDEIEAVKQDRFQAILRQLDDRQLDRFARAMDDVRVAIATAGVFEHAHPTQHRHQAGERD